MVQPSTGHACRVAHVHAYSMYAPQCSEQQEVRTVSSVTSAHRGAVRREQVRIARVPEAVDASARHARESARQEVRFHNSAF